MEPQLASQAWISTQALDAVIDCSYQVQHFEELNKHFVAQSPVSFFQRPLKQILDQIQITEMICQLFKYIHIFNNYLT